MEKEAWEDAEEEFTIAGKLSRWKHGCRSGSTSRQLLYTADDELYKYVIKEPSARMQAWRRLVALDAEPLATVSRIQRKWCWWAKNRETSRASQASPPARIKGPTVTTGLANSFSPPAPLVPYHRNFLRRARTSRLQLPSQSKSANRASRGVRHDDDESSSSSHESSHKSPVLKFSKGERLRVTLRSPESECRGQSPCMIAKPCTLATPGEVSPWVGQVMMT
jgi:hypothetical protein